MDSVDQMVMSNMRENRSHWKWMLRLFIRPKGVMENLAEIDGRAWFKPMLVLTVLVILLSVVGGGARLSAAQMNMAQPPEDFQYWSEEQQNQFFKSQEAMQGPLFIYIFPLLGSIAGLWIGWFLMGSMLLLLMTLKGSRQPQVVYFNLVAWAAVPFALRSLVQLVAVITTQQVIHAPGLSGFIEAGERASLDYFRILLSFVDIYSIWFLLLLLIGAPRVSQIKTKNALGMAVIAVFILAILASIPSFVMNQMGGLGTIQPFLIF